MAPVTRPARASLMDIARHTGLSLATVSRVMGNSPHPISPRTRERVLEVARELGYMPNAIARALAAGTSRTFGVVIGDITDTYFSNIVRGVEDVAREHDHITVICNTQRQPREEAAAVRSLLAQNAAAILLAGGYFPPGAKAHDLRPLLAHSSTRVISLADRDLPGATIFTSDNEAVTFDLANYLIQLGHRRIAFVGGPPGFSVSLQFQAGFERAMQAAGLDATNQLPDGGFGLEFGYAAGAALLARGLPDAVISVSDDTAIAIIDTLAAAGVDVPGQVSVVGVDDAKYSQLFDLTTARLPSYELGVSGARHALGLDAVAPGQRVVLPHRIIPRGSTAPAHGRQPRGLSRRKPRD